MVLIAPSELAQSKRSLQAIVPHHKVLKRIHFASTIWFVLSAACLLLISLRQAGESWWLILSLSGYSTPLVFLIISMYLFAVYRDIARSQKIEIEHPVTTSFCYTVFYVISPFFGGLAGLTAVVWNRFAWNYLSIVAAGSLLATFLVWIVIDPAFGLFEMLLPASRRFRHKRLLEEQALNEQQQISRQRLLNEVEMAEKSELEYWHNMLRPYAKTIAILLADTDGNESFIAVQVVDIGLAAWRMGGLSCMQRLHSIAVEIYRKEHPDSRNEDYISLWWNGIGTWQGNWLDSQKQLDTGAKVGNRAA